MILFASDWEKHPTAIADYNTNNKSFLEYAALLKKMGIKNHLWPLALTQPDLSGIDPHSPNLSKSVKLKIWLECRVNIWYYLREFVRCPPPAGGGVGDPLTANRSNMSLVWSFINHVDYSVIQCRQTGKSLIMDILSNWLVHFGSRGLEFNYLTRSRDLAAKTVRKMKNIREQFPQWAVIRCKRDTDNVYDYNNARLGNRLLFLVGQKDEEGANKTGRGMTTPINFVDEAAFVDKFNVCFGAALGGTGAAREFSRKRGLPFGNILATTAGKLNTPEGAYVYGFIQRSMPWTEVLYDAANEKELHEMICAASGDLDSKTGKRKGAVVPRVVGIWSHRQLGYDDAWLNLRMAEATQQGEDLERDFGNKWTTGSNASPFVGSTLEIISNSRKEPVWVQVDPDTKYVVNWYYSEFEIASKYRDRRFVLGLDTSNAYGRDAIAGVMIDTSTLEVIGDFTISSTSLSRFSLWLGKFMQKNKNCILVPENKSSWPGIFSQLVMHAKMLGLDIPHRVYNTVVQSYNTGDPSSVLRYKEMLAAFRNGNFDVYERYFGINTDQDIRRYLTRIILQDVAATAGAKTNSSKLISELETLVIKNDRVDHMSGCHDDHVMAWLFSHWLLCDGKNLDKYGIDIADVRSNILREKAVKSIETIVEEEHRERVRAEIREIESRLEETLDGFEVQRLELKLNKLIEDLGVVSDTEHNSIESLRTSVAEHRKRTVTPVRNRQEAFRSSLSGLLGRSGLTGKRAA